MVTETHRKLIDNFYKLEAENKKLRGALEEIKPLAATLRTWGVTGDDVWQIVNKALMQQPDVPKKGSDDGN